MEGKDLTKGKLLKNMTILLIPLVLTNLLNSIYNIVDGIWIGNLIGENGVSAITNCYPLTLMVASIATALAVATSVLVSQYYGAKEEEKIKIRYGSVLSNKFFSRHRNSNIDDSNIDSMAKNVKYARRNFGYNKTILNYLCNRIYI